MNVELSQAVLEDLPVIREVFRRSAPSNEGDRELLAAHPELLELPDSAVIGGRIRVALELGG